jgi:hypothetical protein
MKQIKTNRAIVFGVFRPGDSEKALDKVLADSDDPPNVFVEKHLKDFKINSQNLKKEICGKIFLRSDETGFLSGYALARNSIHDIEIELNDHHPLTQFIKKYQAGVQIGGIFSDMLSSTKLDSFNWEQLRNKGRELFNQALRNYQNKKDKKFEESRNLFLNFFRDPLCLWGAYLGTITTYFAPTDKIKLPGDTGTTEDFLLPLLPPITKNQVVQDDIKSLPDMSSINDELVRDNDVTASVPAIYQEHKQSEMMVSLRKDIETDPRRTNPNYLPVASKKILEQLNITRDKMEPEPFLQLCLSDDRLMTYYDRLADILIDGYYEKSGNVHLVMPEMVDEWKSVFSKLLDREFRTVGSLLASIEGLRILAKAFEGVTQDGRPDIIVPNCSLSKLYENDDIRSKFQKLLAQCNNSQGSLAEYIGICVIPRINYTDYSPDEAQYDYDLEESTPQNQKVNDLGDATDFSHLVEHLKFCEGSNNGSPIRMMNLVSLQNDLPVSELTRESFEEHNIMDFIKQIENSAGKEALKHISLCIPDKIFMNKMTLDFCGWHINTQLITIKAAFLVAAIVMRNDSVTKLRQIVGAENKRYVQNDEPGVAVGPQTHWKDGQMNKYFSDLFELADVHSDLDMDAGILAIHNSDDKKYSCFSLLYHEKRKPIALQVFNTAYWADNFYYSVNMIRTRDYLQLHKEDIKSISLVKRELESPKPRGKVKFDDAIRHINTWMPAKIKYNLFGDEKESQEEIVIDV